MTPDEWTDEELEELIPDVPPIEPPPFGWVFAVHKLTAIELDMVNNLATRQLEDTGFLDHQMAVAAYGAVALARRVDRKKYPWSVAEQIMPDEIRVIRKRETEAPEPEAVQDAGEVTEADPT